DLELGGLEVAGPRRHALLAVEGVGPAQARRAGRPHVVAEDLQHLRLVGVDDEQAALAEDGEEYQQDEADDEQAAAPMAGNVDEPAERAYEQHEEQQQHGETRTAVELPFADHGHFLSRWLTAE